MRIYLDNCCFNRPFDDQIQIRIRIETEAKLEIQKRILLKEIELAWSYILDLENDANPFEQRRLVISAWKNRASVDTSETQEIKELAVKYHGMRINSKDSLHLACAVFLQCEYFISTDDNLIKNTAEIREIKVVDPITFIKEGI